MVRTKYSNHDYIEVAVLAARGDVIAQLELDGRLQNNLLDAQLEIVKSCRKGDLKELKIAQKALQASDYQDLEWIREDLKEYRDNRKKEEQSYELMKEYTLPKSDTYQIPDNQFNNYYRNVWGN